MTRPRGTAAPDVAPPVTDLVTVHPLVVVGAGRAGLALVSRLPANMVSGTTVLDAHGEWLHAWASRLKRCGAEHVRVPCTGTPLPAPLGLQSFATATKRTAELLRSSPRLVAVPSVQLYADYVAHACSAPNAAARAVKLRKATVTGLSVLDAQERQRLKLPAGGVRVAMADGSSLVAAQVVLACSFKTAAPLPACLVAAGGPLGVGLDGPHACDVNATPLQTARVAILGGGTTAATLALAALRAGAQVSLLARSHLRKREHDVDASWMGTSMLRQFWQLTEPLDRLRALRAARPGGSVNARQWAALRAALKTGALRIEEHVQVTDATFDTATSQWTLHLRSSASRCDDDNADGDSTALAPVIADVMWCACGSLPDATHDPVVAPLLKDKRTATHTRVVGGLPVLSDLGGGLRWPGVPLYVVGPYAALAVGPAAGLHAGQRMAAEAVASALTKHAAAAAAGDAPYDAPAGALDLDGLDAGDAEAEALESPFFVLPAPAQPPKQGIDLCQLPQGLPRRNLGSYAWADASGGSDADAADMGLTVRAPLPEALGGVHPLCEFTSRSADVWVVGAEAAYRLHLPALFRDVVPRRCSARVVDAGERSTLIVTLYKSASAPWRMLKTV